MMTRDRRQFLADVGKGMLIASVGPALASNLGISPAFAGEGSDKLTFGNLEPLVSLMQETAPAKLLPILIEKIKNGTELKTLIAAGTLANARTFGGHDYDGYHAFMALAPAYHMAQETADDRRALPILKVLYRNSQFIQNFGGVKNEKLHTIEAAAVPEGKPHGEALRDAMRKGDQTGAEKMLAGLAKDSVDDAYNSVLYCVQDELDVHRVVLAWRAWATLDLAGKENALTLLRQSVHFCCESEQRKINQKRPDPGIRALLPKLLDQHKLIGRSAGTRKGDDAWIEQLCQTIYVSQPAQAAEAVAAALGEGFSPEDVGEAMSLAANRLVLRDPGRARAETGKPIGSVHGASVGVHASDSANAWRNISRVSNQRNQVASLIVGGYHTAGQASRAAAPPYPTAEHLETVKAKDAKGLLAEAEAAIKARDQVKACATVYRYGELGHPQRPVFDLLLKFATSEDGALHAEKYYRTVSEEFASTREAYRWRHLVGLARVSASEYGFPAPGYAEACKMLKV